MFGLNNRNGEMEKKVGGWQSLKLGFTPYLLKMKFGIVLFVFISIFCLSNSKKTVKSGYLIYKLIDKNNLYFIDNINFINDNKKSYKYNVAILNTFEEHHPFFDEKNYKHLTKVYYNHEGLDNHNDSFYFAKVELVDIDYFYSNWREKKTHIAFYYNKKFLQFKIKHIASSGIIYK